MDLEFLDFERLGVAADVSQKPALGRGKNFRFFKRHHANPAAYAVSAVGTAHYQDFVVGHKTKIGN